MTPRGGGQRPATKRHAIKAMLAGARAKAADASSDAAKPAFGPGPEGSDSGDHSQPQFQAKNRITVSGSYAVGLVGGLGVLTAILIAGVFSQLGSVLIYIGVALFVALGLDPLVTWLERKFSRPIAILIVFGAAVVVFAGILLLVVPSVVRQVTSFVNTLPQQIADVQHSGFIDDLDNQLSGVIDINALLDSAQTFVKGLTEPANLAKIGTGLLAVGSGIAQAATGAIVVLILTLYFLASMRQMKALACRFVPARRRARYSLLQDEICHAVGRYVVGQASLAAVNGVCSFIYLTIIGAPNPALLAIIAFCGSLIPLVGTLSGSIVISLTCLIASPVTALAAAIYYLIYMQIEAYVLSPRIMSKAVKVPGAIVVIAAIAGGTIGGVLGALVAIPIAASGIIIVQKVVFPVQDAKTEELEPASA